MCGIHGFIDKGLSHERRDHVLQKMAESTIHRGPDFLGYKIIDAVAFAHNRLSIIDLTETANQPMVKGACSLVFNGEIYNYKELKEELLQCGGHEFKTNSDTEVILAAYLEWGVGCVNKFLGMWAFVIYDQQKDILFCSRDRFGIKPFYYIHQDQKFYFSSEVKSLKNSPAFSNILNEGIMQLSVQLGWVSAGEQTLYKQVLQLPPATNLIFTKGKITITKYWEVEPSNSIVTDEEAIFQFNNLFEDSLQKHIRSDVKLGATLSGGIDSSAIVSAICGKKMLPGINTFSVYYDGKGEIDERPFVDDVAKKYPAVKASYLQPSMSEVEEHFDKITHHNDFPLSGSSPISQYFLMKEIHQSGIKVILSGQGADDYLGGYLHSYYRFYADLIKQGNLSSLVIELKKQIEYQGLNHKQLASTLVKTGASLFYNEQDLLSLECERAKVFPFENKRFQMPTFNVGSNRFNDFHQGLLMYSSLPTLLHYEDRNSMAFSIESRVPFLDHRLVEQSFKLANHQKIRKGYTKWVLRKALGDVLPKSIKHRKDKIGFVTPGESKWLRKELSHLLNIEKSDIPGLDEKKIKKVISRFKNGENQNAKIIWRVASLNHWIKNFA